MMSAVGQARDLSKSDTANDKFSWLMVTGSTGSVILDLVGGNEVTLAAVPVGVWIPVGNATNVTTSSTASGFMVF